MINELAEKAHANSKSKGFFDNERNIGEMLCLIHSEVSEALEADRKGEYARVKEFELSEVQDRPFELCFPDYIKDTFEDELADIMIRVMDLAAYKNIDLEKHIKLKMRFNALREHKHGKKY